MFSLLCMMTTTACVYYETKHLFDQNCAILAAALFAFQGPVLFLGRLATYDALCLVLIALAVVLALHVSTARTTLGHIGYWSASRPCYPCKICWPVIRAFTICFPHLVHFSKSRLAKNVVRLVLALCSLAVAGVYRIYHYRQRSTSRDKLYNHKSGCPRKNCSTLLDPIYWYPKWFSLCIRIARISTLWPSTTSHWTIAFRLRATCPRVSYLQR